MDDRVIARWRLHTHRLAGEPRASIPAVVEGLLAVQAENHRQAWFALATRAAPDLTEPDVARLFDDGVILRTHVLRPTWHFVLPEDIRWLVELTAPRVRRSFAQVQRQVGLSDDDLDRSAHLIVDALAEGTHLTRDALAERLADEGLASTGFPLIMMLANVEQAGLVCSGVMAGSEQTYALLEERAPGARRLEREEAVAELVLRYFTGHGPATERDLSYWASMTVTDVRAGLAEVAGQLDRVEHDGRTYWYAQPPPDDDGVPSPRAHLLLTLDEYHNGYQDSRYSLDADGIVPRKRGRNVGMTLIDGQMVGDMRRTIGSREVRFDVGLFRDLDADEHDALLEAADRAGRFLGLDATVVTSRSR